MPPDSRAPDLVDVTSPCPLAVALAGQLREHRRELTGRWLDRIVARVALDPNRVFPTSELLDHVPLLVLGVADYIEDPARDVAAEMPVVAKAMELGELRHSQGFAVHEIQREYELLGGILFTFLAQTVDGIDQPCSRGELLVCAHRLFRAIALIQQASTTQFAQRAAEEVRDREDRLRAFNRALSHEFKNQIHAALGASQLMSLEAMPAEELRRLAGIVARSLEDMGRRVESLLDLTRLDVDTRRQRHVLLPQAAAESVRRLRETAAARNVELRLAESLPPVEVHAGAVELCLANYLSNAIKYADPAKEHRWASIHGAVRPAPGGDCELVVEVRDNGLGVPPEARNRLFGRFVRAHEGAVTGVEGTGLGLSIVRETVEALGGRAWADFGDDGSAFAFALPCRRSADMEAVGG